MFEIFEQRVKQTRLLCTEFHKFIHLHHPLVSIRRHIPITFDLRSLCFASQSCRLLRALAYTFQVSCFFGSTWRLYGETQHFVERLRFKAVWPNIAPASDKPRSPNLTCATKIYMTTSSNIAFATKSVVPFLLFLSYFFGIPVPSFTWLFLYCSWRPPLFFLNLTVSLLYCSCMFSFTAPSFTWQFLKCFFLYLAVTLQFFSLLDCSLTFTCLCVYCCLEFRASVKLNFN